MPSLESLELKMWATKCRTLSQQPLQPPSIHLERVFAAIVAAVAAIGEALEWSIEKDVVDERIVVKRRRPRQKTESTSRGPRTRNRVAAERRNGAVKIEEDGDAVVNISGTEENRQIVCYEGDGDNNIDLDSDCKIEPNDVKPEANGHALLDDFHELPPLPSLTRFPECFVKVDRLDSTSLPILNREFPKEEPSFDEAIDDRRDSKTTEEGFEDPKVIVDDDVERVDDEDNVDEDIDGLFDDWQSDDDDDNQNAREENEKKDCFGNSNGEDKDGNGEDKDGNGEDKDGEGGEDLDGEQRRTRASFLRIGDARKTPPKNKSRARGNGGKAKKKKKKEKEGEDDDPSWDPDVVEKKEKEERERKKAEGDAKRQPGRRGRPLIYPKFDRDDENVFRCDVGECRQPFHSAEKLTTHMKVDHRKFLNICRVCGQEFLHYKRYNLHKDSEHPPPARPRSRRYPCPDCSRTFSTPANVKLHQRLEHRFDTLLSSMKRCEFCGETFEVHYQKAKHVIAEHADKANGCRVCYRVYYPKEGTLVRHLLDCHDGEGVLACKWCENVKFAKKSSFLYHLDVKHPEEESPVPRTFLCSKLTCQLPFSSADNLARHALTHVPRPPSQTDCPPSKTRCPPQEKRLCPHCGRSVNRYDFNQHIATHESGDRSFSCKKCDARFESKTRLKRHLMYTHVKRFSCPHCGKVLTRPSTLLRHIRSVHEGENHPCNMCDKTYSCRGDLSIHVKAFHEGKRWYCSVCRKEFMRSSEKNRHEREVHGLATYRNVNANNSACTDAIYVPVDEAPMDGENGRGLNVASTTTTTTEMQTDVSVFSLELPSLT